MRFVIVLALVGGAISKAPRSTPKEPMLDERIVGGADVDIADHPYQLSLRRDGSHICGASIISADWAVTAAQCVNGMTPSSMDIRSGSSLHDSGGTLHTITSIIAHPGYSSNTIDYDIAVIRVSTAFSIGSTGVNAIGLPTADSTPATGAMATVSGWGTLSVDSSIFSNQLQAVDLPIVSTSTCSAVYVTSEGTATTDRMLCTGFPEGGKDSCHGDAGGPLVINDILVGVISWGYGCAFANYPRVFSNVGNLRNWIQTNTGI